MTASLAMALDSPSLNIGTAGHGKQSLTLTRRSHRSANGFTVLWMDQSTYLANGGQFVTGDAASFTGSPTLNTFGGQFSTFKLAPISRSSWKSATCSRRPASAVRRRSWRAARATTTRRFANDEYGNAASAMSVTVSIRPPSRPTARTPSATGRHTRGLGRSSRSCFVASRIPGRAAGHPEHIVGGNGLISWRIS